MRAPGQAAEGAVAFEEIRGNGTSATLPKYLLHHHCQKLWQALEGLDLSAFDAIHTEYLAMAPYGIALKRRRPQLNLTINLDNINSEYAKREMWQSFSLAHPKRAWWQFLEYSRLRAATRAVISEVDDVWVCSAQDETLLRKTANPRRCTIVPNCVDVDSYSNPTERGDRRKLVVTGSMGEGPNSHGVLKFCNAGWDGIRQRHANAELWIVGKDPTPAVRMLADKTRGIHVTGAVPDIRPYLADAQLSLVPVWFGTGTRLKVLEAFAARCSVVSTPMGAEGIECRDGESITLAASPRKLAERCIDLLGNPERRSRQAAAGYGLVKEKYDWPVVARQIEKSYAARDERLSCRGTHSQIFRSSPTSRSRTV